MQLGKPVVATDISGSRDLIRNGENGLLVEPSDSEGLANAIVRLLLDSSLSSAVSRNAEVFVRRYMNPTAIGRKTESVYFRALSVLQGDATALARGESGKHATKAPSEQPMSNART
jgi:glycosyltransferase involved in cell wall biosynthesis